MKKLLILFFAVTAWTNILAQQQSHIVQRGETFELIARRYNISVQQLMEVNPAVDQCYIGYKLNLPEGAKRNTRMVTITDNDIMLAEKASDYLKSGNYGKATTTYTKAIENNPSSVLYFGRGMSYYNREKYKSAINDFEMAMSMSDCADEMKTQCEKLISTAEQLRDEKRERRSETWGGIAAALVGAVAVTATAVMANSNSNNAYMPPSKMNGFRRDTSLDYLLDPRFAMMQVQQQEYEEYETFKKLTGADISLEEYRLLRAQANSQNQELEREENVFNKTDSKPRISVDNSCSYCNGKGKIEVNQSVPTYGTSPYKKKCNICGWEYMSGTAHSHHDCPYCGGTGKRR